MSGPRPGTTRRRRPRLAANEVRERMFEAAKELLRTHGVLVSLEEITLEEVVRTAGIPRSSAYRIWPYKGDFVADLMIHLAGPETWLGTAGFDQKTLLVACDVILEHWHRLDSEEGRRAVVREAARQALEQNMISVAESIEWEVYVALVATARGNSQDESRQELTAVLKQTEITLVGIMAEFYEAIFDGVGLQLRDEALTYGHLAIAGASVVEGIALRAMMIQATDDSESNGLLEGLINTPVPGPGIDGNQTDWTIAGWAYLAILEAAVVPTPGWSPTDERRAKVEGLRQQALDAAASVRMADGR